MAIDLSNVTAITIPEGEVIEISINGTTVWSAGSSPSPYIWTTIDDTSRTMGSAGSYSSITEFATIPSDAVSLRLTLSYSQNPNNYTFYDTDLNGLSVNTVKNSLTGKPTNIDTGLEANYLFAIRYRRSQTSSTEQYACYWYLNITSGNKLNLIRSYAAATSPTSRVGMYPITITKIEAAIPNPDYQA